MQRSIHAKPGLGSVLHVVQAGGGPLWRVQVDSPALILVHAGRKRLRSGRSVCVAQPGEMIAVAAGVEIEVANEPPAAGPYTAQCLSFDPEFCSACEHPQTPARAVSPAAALGRPPEFLLAAFARAAASCASAAAPPDGILRHQFQEVLLGLELTGWRFDVRHATRTAGRIRRLIGAEPARRWKIGDLGRLLGMSEATLRRKLGQERLGFRTIVAQVRMGRALALLQSSELSVTQIAYAVGYESPSQFTAKFRRHFGRSPAHLRAGNARS